MEGEDDHKVPPLVGEFLSADGYWDSVSDFFRDAAPEGLLLLQ